MHQQLPGLQVVVIGSYTWYALTSSSSRMDS